MKNVEKMNRDQLLREAAKLERNYQPTEITGGENMKRGQEQMWQRDPEHLKTDQVQFWTETGIMQGLISLALAKDTVATGRAFVVCDQAIGRYVD